MQNHIDFAGKICEQDTRFLISEFSGESFFKNHVFAFLMQYFACPVCSSNEKTITLQLCKDPIQKTLLPAVPAYCQLKESQTCCKVYLQPLFCS